MNQLLLHADAHSIVPSFMFYVPTLLKNGASLILPSGIARNSLAPNAKRIFESCEGFLRAALTVHGHPGPV